MGKLKQVVNSQEAAVDRLLNEYAREHGYRILMKTRLRDMLDLDDEPLTSRERNFAYGAHLDFVAVDLAANLPVLAVEYDGPQHNTDPVQVERDAIKDRLCDAAGLPMLRIDNQFTRKAGKWRVLTYILSMHDAGKAFTAAQEQGLIPEDEPFIHNSIIDTSDPTRPGFTGLDREALLVLFNAAQTRNAKWHAYWWREHNGRMEVRHVLELSTGYFLDGYCALRNFAVEGISALEVAQELATAQLGTLVTRYDAGEAVALGPRQGERLLTDLGRDFFAKGSPGGWHLAGGYGIEQI